MTTVQRVYIGMFDEVDIHDQEHDFHLAGVKRDTEFDVPSEVAKKLDEQPDNFATPGQALKQLHPRAARTRAAKKAEAPAPETPVVTEPVAPDIAEEEG